MTPDQIHSLVADLLFPTLIGFAGLVGYIFGLRPLLKQNPAFKQLYATEDTMINALSAKLGGLKQKIATLVISAAGFVVVAHDSITSLLSAAGIDPVAYGSQILPKVPPMAWPLITIAVIWLIQHFRNLADNQARANAEALLNAGHSLAAPAPGLSINTLPSPAPVLNAFPDKKD